MLTQRERTIVEAFYLHCLSDREIALKLGSFTTRQNIAKQRLAALAKINSSSVVDKIPPSEAY